MIYQRLAKLSPKQVLLIIGSCLQIIIFQSWDGMVFFDTFLQAPEVYSSFIGYSFVLATLFYIVTGYLREGFMAGVHLSITMGYAILRHEYAILSQIGLWCWWYFLGLVLSHRNPSFIENPET